LSFDGGKTWSQCRLITAGGPERELPSIDRSTFKLSDTMAESAGLLTATQACNGCIHLLSSKNHDVFNFAWLKALPHASGK